MINIRPFFRGGTIFFLFLFFFLSIEKSVAAPRVTFAEIERNQLHSVRNKLEQGANPEEKDRNGATLLWMAAARGETRMVQLLLSFGANPDQPDLSGKTPLYWAASNGYTRIVKLLLAHGADPNRSGGESSAMEWAVANKHADVVEVLKRWTVIRRHYLLRQLPRYLDRIPISQRKRLEQGKIISGHLPYPLPNGILRAPWKSRNSFVREALKADIAFSVGFGRTRKEPLWRKRAIQEIALNLKGYNPLP